MNDGQPPGERTITRAAPQGDGASWAFELPDRWHIERFLGSGGQSEVWLAHDSLLGELVAVKVFNPALSREAMERLRQEVKLGRSLRHPNLVRVYELIEAGGRLAMAMEWLPGGSVAQKLSGGPLPIPEVLQVAEETLAALAHLHEQRIVHRDVKPSNLLLDESGHVRLADLGLGAGARRLGSPDPDGHGCRDARVHEPRADPRGTSNPGDGPLRTRGDRVPPHYRPAPVPGCL